MGTLSIDITLCMVLEPPCEFSRAAFKDDNIEVGYWVKLHCFFDGSSVHSFFFSSDMIDNMLLARECGVSCTNFSTKILVTSSHHSDIFYKIRDYVQSTGFD